MKRPPVAPRWPIVGNALSFMRAPLAFLRSMTETHGDVVAKSFRVEVLDEPIPLPSVTLRPKKGVRARFVKR